MPPNVFRIKLSGIKPEKESPITIRLIKVNISSIYVLGIFAFSGLFLTKGISYSSTLKARDAYFLFLMIVASPLMTVAIGSSAIFTFSPVASPSIPAK